MSQEKGGKKLYHKEKRKKLTCQGELSSESIDAINEDDQESSQNDSNEPIWCI